MRLVIVRGVITFDNMTPATEDGQEHPIYKVVMADKSEVSVFEFEKYRFIQEVPKGSGNA